MKRAAPVDSAACRDEATRLLPWFVNGTLAADEARRVRAHLDHCASCRDEAGRLERMRALLRAPAVEHAPHAGLRKLMARVERQQALDAAAEDAAAGAAAAGAAQSAGNSAAAAPRRPRWRPLRWLAAAVVVQACAIAVIGVALLDRPADPPAAFRTLTSDSTAGPRLRVVFVPTMSLGELHELLRAHRLVALSGPSEAGLFTLALPPAADAREQAEAVARLRADARVRFAEALGGEAAR